MKDVDVVVSIADASRGVTFHCHGPVKRSGDGFITLERSEACLEIVASENYLLHVND